MGLRMRALVSSGVAIWMVVRSLNTSVFNFKRANWKAILPRGNDLSKLSITQLDYIQFIIEIFNDFCPASRSSPLSGDT